MINLICNLSGTKRCPDICLNILLGVSVRVLPEGISIWIHRRSNTGRPPQCGWSSWSSLKAWVEQSLRKGKSSLSLNHRLWVRTLIFSCLHSAVAQSGTYSLSSLGSQVQTRTIPSALRGLQPVICISLNFSASITAWAMLCNKHKHRYRYKDFVWFSFSREHTLIPIPSTPHSAHLFGLCQRQMFLGEWQWIIISLTRW